MLDKSKGLVLGNELVTNGDFSNGTTGWTTSVTGSNVITIGSGYVRFQTTGADTASLIQNNVYTIGKWYVVEFDVLAGSSGQLKVSRMGYSADEIVFSCSAGRKKFIGLITGTNPAFLISRVVGQTADAYIDNITVKELAGNSAYQTTSASRPTLSALYNLLTYTEQFDNAVWAKNESSVTANAAIAPDGTLTADKFIPNTVLANHRIAQNISAWTLGVTYTFSFYAKAAEYTVAHLYDAAFSGVVIAYFDLSAGTYSVPTSTLNPTVSMTNVGNGWYRCVCTATATNNLTNSSGFARIGVGNTANIAGDGTSGIYIWGAQLIVTNSLLSNAYQRVAASGTYDSDLSKFPYYLKFDGVDDSMATSSIDFSTVTSDGQARRNLLTYPTAFDDAAWTKYRTTITANATTAPDGTATADQLVNTATTNTFGFYFSTTVVPTGTTTLSIYLKKSTQRYLALAASDTSAAYAAIGIDLDAGSITRTEATGGKFTLVSSSISNVGSGWYRVSLTVTISTGTTYFELNQRNTEWTSGTFVEAYTGTTSQSTYVWGAQLETGSSATAFQNIGTDKMTVWAGVRKASDAARAVVVELSASYESFNGAFQMSAPATITTNSYGSLSGGTGGGSGAYATGFTAPITSVVCSSTAISTDTNIIRVNAAQIATNSADQGSGNYGNYPLYIGRRNNATLPFNGNLYSLIVRGAQSSGNDLSNTENWVNTKTGAY